MLTLPEKEPLVFRLLQKDLDAGRLSQCYLFTGEGNPYKKEVAYQFAAAILAGEKKWPSEDNSLLQRIKDGNYYDFYYLNAREESLKTETIDNLQKELQKTALEEGSARKVFVVDNINNASLKVYNQLLKFIEETPGETTFGILITDNVDALLPTIVSRCKQIPFRYEARKDVAKQYQELGFSAEDAYLLSFVYPHYHMSRPDDLTCSAAFALLDVSLQHLSKDREYFVYYLQNVFYPTFKNEEEGKNLLQEAGKIYLRMLMCLCKDALGTGYFSTITYQEKLKTLRENNPVALYLLLADIYNLCMENTDQKLLFDRFAYYFCKLGRNEYV